LNNYDQTDKPGMGPSPYTVVLDELAYYATSGLDRMLSQGRGLNISFMLGFQEVSGIWARLGEKTASLLGNTNTTIAMRQQDSGRTREWLEKTAGQTNVTQATSYQGAADGAYREARHTEVRIVSRVDWNDLTSLIEGEAIVLFGSRIRLFRRCPLSERGLEAMCAPESGSP
jgi:intracellular multiplication protein IcmO